MKAIVAILFFSIIALSLSGQSDWALKKEDDGIKIYHRDSKVSKFDDIKVTADFTGNINQFAEILLDVSKYTEWAYATKTCEIVKKTSPADFIYYSETTVPWPSSNRDLYAHCVLTENKAAHSFKLIAATIKDYKPLKDGIIRVPYSVGTWNVTTLPNKMIHVEYILELDPGGSVPAWLLDLFSSKGPLETFTALKKKMQLLNK
jgi:hypothetical protein